MKWFIGKAHYMALTLLALTPALFVGTGQQGAESQGKGTTELAQANDEAAQTVKTATPAPAQPVVQAQHQAHLMRVAAQTTPAQTSAAAQPAQAQPAPAQTRAQGGAAAAYVPDVSFTLRTDVAEGKLVYIGVGDEIDGVVNPELRVKLDDVVQITLVNGDGAQHDIAMPDFSAKSDLVTGEGASTVTVFRADTEGTFAYFCTVPGHRQAGMEGVIVVEEEAVAEEENELPSIVRDPSELPDPIGKRGPITHDLTLTTTELEARLADGTSYKFWTFNSKVPGPMLRTRVGDTVNLTLENAKDSTMIHSIDLHAVNGPGGGATVTQIQPGKGATFTFKALNPGLYVYHCATPMVAYHVTNGMYGLILVEPEGGLPEVDKEFYVMQGEIYTHEAFGQRGHMEPDVQKLLGEDPEYFVFNGAVGSLTDEYPMQANVGETVRIFFGVGGPNFTSSVHVIGEVFDRVYNQASLTSPPLTNVSTTLVPAGGATMVEFKLEVPGRYILADHSLSRAERGLVGFLEAEGEENPEVFRGTVTPGGGH